MDESVSVRGSIKQLRAYFSGQAESPASPTASPPPSPNTAATFRFFPPSVFSRSAFCAAPTRFCRLAIFFSIEAHAFRVFARSRFALAISFFTSNSLVVFSRKSSLVALTASEDSSFALSFHFFSAAFSLCLSSCAARASFFLARKAHPGASHVRTSHASPCNALTWYASAFRALNALTHPSLGHTNGLSPVCVRSCAVSSLRSKKRFPQPPCVQTCEAGSPLCCFLTCFVKSCGHANCASHPG
mmetsp:Transcript_4796/g.16011  ORF Transcript_4796/g.16011 Transcript_4796/m.16011 type:complete len:244 (+) Transcript_4796:88-819(+)